MVGWQHRPKWANGVRVVHVFYKSEQISPEWRGSAACAVPVQGVGECYASPEGKAFSLRELRDVV